MTDANFEPKAVNDLTALIGSRICHDLISPLGAIGNGVELMSMTGAGAAPEVGLISESIENANARIRFFRVAFGAASPGAELGQSEIVSLLNDIYKTSRIQVNWRVDGTMKRRDVKLAFLLLLCLDNLLPWGGRVAVARSGEQWRIEARADKFRVQQNLWDMLGVETSEEISASEVHFALVRGAAEAARRQVATFLGDDRATLTF